MGDIYSNTSLRIVETRDFNLIRKLIYHEDLYGTLSSFMGNDELIEEGLDDPRKSYFIYYCGDDIAGIVVILNFTNIPNSPNTFFVDIGILKKFRGKIGFELSKLMLQIFKSSNDVFRLLGVVSADNYGCISFSKKMGFKIIERTNNFFLFEDQNGRSS